MSDDSIDVENVLVIDHILETCWADDHANSDEDFLNDMDLMISFMSKYRQVPGLN